MSRTLSLLCLALPLLVACGGGGGGSDAAPLPDPIPEVLAPGPHAILPMHHARRGHVAIRLRDGRVLVVGGSEVTNRGEIYDPRRGEWELTAPFASARTGGHTVTEMRDGRVFVSSGLRAFGVNEIYDPLRDRVEAAPGFEIPRRRHHAVRLLDGRILFAGGRDSEVRGNNLDSMEIYDPGTAQMRLLVDRMLHTRSSFLAELLADGRVLMTGAGSSITDLFDPVTETVVRSAASFGPRHTWSPLSVRLADGRVIVPAALSRPDSALLYDPGADGFGDGGAVVEPRTATAVIALPDGRAIMIGGRVADGVTRTPGVEVFDPVTGAWSAMQPMIDPIESHQAILLEDDLLLICGGGLEDGPTADAWVYRMP